MTSVTGGARMAPALCAQDACGVCGRVRRLLRRLAVWPYYAPVRAGISAWLGLQTVCIAIYIVGVIYASGDIKRALHVLTERTADDCGRSNSPQLNRRELHDEDETHDQQSAEDSHESETDLQRPRPRAGCGITPLTATAQLPDVQVPTPTIAKDVPGPVPGNVMTKYYVQMVGRMAYMWGYPMVNAYNRRKAFSEAPSARLLGGIVPVAPVGYNAMLTNYIDPQKRFIVCPNQDVVYGAGYTALDTEPTVVQVPDFGDRFYVFALYYARTDEIARIGKQYGTKPGFYLIAGENWKGWCRRESPQWRAGRGPGVRDSTRVQGRHGSRHAGGSAAAQPGRDVSVEQIRRDDEGCRLRQAAAFSGAPASGSGETKWVKPATYYDDLSAMMERVPPLPGEHALYGWIRSVWQAAAKDATPSNSSSNCSSRLMPNSSTPGSNFATTADPSETVGPRRRTLRSGAPITSIAPPSRNRACIRTRPKKRNTSSR